MSYLESPSTDFNLPPSQFSQYDCPSIFKKLGDTYVYKPTKELHAELGLFIRNCIDEGSNFIKNSRAYSSIYNAIDIICRATEPYTQNLTPASLPNTTKQPNISNVWANNTKRQIAEVCATLSNIRPSWVYEPNSRSDEDSLQRARVQNGLSDDWYSNSDVDITLRKLLELGTVEGTGYISPIWNPELNNDEGGIELKLYRYNEVLPVQIGREYDLQRAYAVVLIDEMPINRARKIFYQKRDELVPDRGETRLARGSIYSAATNKIKGFWDAITAGNREQRKTFPCPVVDVLYTYVDDFSINPTNEEILMGDFDSKRNPLTSWSYKVPYINQPIFDGYKADGSIKTRNATARDCRLYPNRRLIIATKTCILYDGPSYWMHRKVPVIKYSPDEWIFSYLGFSMAAEVYSLDVSANKMSRDVEDALHLKLDPPMAADKMQMSKSQAETNSLRTPGKRILGNLSMGDFMKPLVPPENYELNQSHFEFIEKTVDKLKELLGIQDLRALMQARQVPSSDTISQFFSQAGALVTKMSRSLDPVMKFIADCNLGYFYQFYDITRRIKILGKDGYTKIDFDYEPGTLIPKTLPYEPMVDPLTHKIVQQGGIYLSSQTERAKYELSNYRTSIEATSLHQITHMQRKLLLMQSTKLFPGYPLVDPETIAKQLDIPNWGHLEGDTVQQKLYSWMQAMKDFQIETQIDMGKAQLLLQMMAAMNSPMGQMLGAVGSLAGQASNGSPPPTNGATPKSEGRPPDFNGPPTLVNKAGDRTTITGHQ